MDEQAQALTDCWNILTREMEKVGYLLYEGLQKTCEPLKSGIKCLATSMDISETCLESNMKPGEIILSKPTRHHSASIDGCTIEVVAISISNEPRLNAHHVVLEGYAYPNTRLIWDEYSAGNCFFPYYIDRVIFSGPMTIVFWTDGTKTKVRLHQGKKKTGDNRYMAIMWAMAKKYYGTRSQLEKRLRSCYIDAKHDDGTVQAILMTLFGDPKKLDEYVCDALKIAEDYN